MGSINYFLVVERYWYRFNFFFTIRFIRFIVQIIVADGPIFFKIISIIMLAVGLVKLPVMVNLPMASKSSPRSFNRHVN